MDMLGQSGQLDQSDQSGQSEFELETPTKKQQPKKRLEKKSPRRSGKTSKPPPTGRSSRQSSQRQSRTPPTEKPPAILAGINTCGNDDFPPEDLIRKACAAFESSLARLAKQDPMLIRPEDYRLIVKVYLSALSYRYTKIKGRTQPFLFEKTHPPEYFLERMRSAADHFVNDFALYDSLVDFESLRLDDATIENLEAAGIESVESICSLTEHELGSIDQISEAKVEQIKVALAAYGKRLKPKPEPKMLW